jgi:hypothetical protein
MKKLFLYSLLLSLLVSNAKATTYYFSNSGVTGNTGLTTGSPWPTSKLTTAFVRGNTVLFHRGETFYVKIPTLATSGTTQIEIGSYGSGALPVLTVYSTILSTAWVSAGTNIWKANITTSSNVSGFTPSLANCGFIKTVDSIYGERRFTIAGLVKQWQFYCNFGSGTTGAIYVYSTSKPSLVSATIQVSNDEKIINLSDYEYIHDVKISGTAQAGLLTDQPVRLHIAYVHVEEVGGKFKSLTDSLREGAGISFYNGATNDTVDHCYVSYAFECAYTNQTHASGAVPILYKNLYYWRDTSFKCESSYNPSIAVSGAHGFSGCLIDTCYFSYDGYSWSHPPVKPTDNQAIGQLNNFWQGIPSENDLIVQNCTYYAPREGLIFMSGSSATVPWTQRNNHIWLDSAEYIRKNTPGGSIKWPYRFMVTSGGGHTAYVTASGSEVGSDWNCLNCHVVGSHTYYRDADGDGFGDPAVTSTGTVQPSGYVNDNTDCNDADATLNPTTKWYLDLDGDGYYNTTILIQCDNPGTGYIRNPIAGQDCNDNDASIHPGAVELCDGIDNNCDGFIDNGVQSTFYRDNDGDGYGDANNTVLACSAPSGYVSDATDCNDNNSAVNPGASEVCGNGIDDNCNGQIDEGCGTNPTISIADTTVAESAGQVSVRIYLSATSTLATKVDYYTIDGTATFPRDFKQAKGTATIAAGSLSTWITIKVSADKILEPTEVFSVLLQNPVNATISDNKADISITNSP